MYKQTPVSFRLETGEYLFTFDTNLKPKKPMSASKSVNSRGKGTLFPVDPRRNQVLPQMRSPQPVLPRNIQNIPCLTQAHNGADRDKGLLITYETDCDKVSFVALLKPCDVIMARISIFQNPVPMIVRTLLVGAKGETLIHGTGFGPESDIINIVEFLFTGSVDTGEPRICFTTAVTF